MSLLVQLIKSKYNLSPILVGYHVFNNRDVVSSDALIETSR